MTEESGLGWICFHLVELPVYEVEPVSRTADPLQRPEDAQVTSVGEPSALRSDKQKMKPGTSEMTNSLYISMVRLQ